jgi:outer membrane protein assembly factor BamB
MSTRARRPRSALAAVWILVACAAVGTGIGLVVRQLRSDHGSGPSPIRVRPARPGPQSAAGLWLFGATTVRLDPVTLTDPRDVGFRGFGAVLGGDGTVYLYDPTTGRVGVIDATRNALAGKTTVPVQGVVGADEAPVLAEQRGALWLVTGAGRLTRDDLATGSTTDVTLPADVVSEQAAGGPPAPGATRVVADAEAAWAVYDLGVTGNPPLPAAVRLADDGGITARAALPDRVGGDRLEPQAVALGDNTVWVVGRRAIVALDPATLAVRQSFNVQSAAPIELHGAAVAGGLVWSYDLQSGALFGIDPATGSVRRHVALTNGGTQFRAPATIVAGTDVLWVRVRIGSSDTLEQLITRVDARSGDVTGRFTAPPQLEVGEIAVSR